MRTQLIERYLERTGCRHGIYLVGWYECEVWDRSDRRHRPSLGCAREALERDLCEAAAELELPEGSPLLVPIAVELVGGGRLAEEPRRCPWGGKRGVVAVGRG